MERQGDKEEIQFIGKNAVNTIIMILNEKSQIISNKCKKIEVVLGLINSKMLKTGENKRKCRAFHRIIL